MKRSASVAVADKKGVGKDDPKSLGVLYTGYLDKRNPVSGAYNQRFVVLTYESIHWFLRPENYDLFGEERGHIVLVNVLSTRIIDEDSTVFEICALDGKKTFFRASTPVFCEEWVSAIRSAVKNAASGMNKKSKRASLAGIKSVVDDDETQNADRDESLDVTVLLVSFKSSAQSKRQIELVISRNPEWGRVINIPPLQAADQVIISTSNGGVVTLKYENIIQKAEDGMDFEQTVQNVTLASSLKLCIIRDSSAAETDALEGFNREANSESRSKMPLFLSGLLQTVILLTSERSSAISLVLSMMVLMAASSSCRYVGVDTSLLFLLAALLAAYNLKQSLDRVKSENNYGNTKGLSLRLIILSHSFTSPDAPINEDENDIPIRFVEGCGGDMKEARRRWDISRHWFESEKVNDILNEPQPYFSLIKQMYPHYNCGRGKDGHAVFYERVCDFEGEQLAARGVGIEELFRHWLFCTEYQWRVLCKEDSDTAKGINVMDVDRLTLGFLTGDNLTFLKKTLNVANQHYPERCHVIFVINAPWISSMLWKMFSPLVHENTRKKIKILSAKDSLTGMLEHIPISQIPSWYGGEMDFGGKDSARFQCKEAVDMAEYVRKLNERHGLTGNTESIQTSVPFSRVDSESPGIDGMLSPLVGGSAGQPSGSPSSKSNGMSGLSTKSERGSESPKSAVSNLAGNHALPSPALSVHSSFNSPYSVSSNTSSNTGNYQSQNAPRNNAPPLGRAATMSTIQQNSSSGMGGNANNAPVLTTSKKK
jgi:hypothetical protein